MLETSAPLKSTPLSSDHATLGAKMAPFAGWNMPIQYQGILAETLHTRRACACFDICHMGEFLIRGDIERSGLDKIISGRMKNCALGSCRYSSILNENGGVIDDLIVYRKDREEWMIVVNAATIEKDKSHFLAHLSRDAEFHDLSGALGKIDLQGPLSRDVLKTVAPKAAGLEYYTFMETDLLGKRNIVSRTGYTGELGFELYAPADRIASLWKKLLEDPRVKPAGLGSRDVLRLEMGYSLYGQDIDEDTTPLEAGLEKYIDFNKDFIGKDALLKQKKEALPRSRVFFQTTSRRSPRHHHKITAGGPEIGTVTSGTFSPHGEKGIGMGFVTRPLKSEDRIFVGDATLKIEAVVCDKPFVRETSLKK
jgi:aminomethyltransferase